ncbi:hypothetical protein FQA39_LY06473 [Lamprigera yunnana]|nr:hypothetical protein FQA39_LY06473 [Lamprigera yunnana]
MKLINHNTKIENEVSFGIGTWHKGKMIEKVRDRIQNDNGKYLIRNKCYLRSSKCDSFHIPDFDSKYVASHVFASNNDKITLNRVEGEKDSQPSINVIKNLNSNTVDYKTNDCTPSTSSPRRIVKQPAKFKDFVMY